jgi:hypothetical protein
MNLAISYFMFKSCHSAKLSISQGLPEGSTVTIINQYSILGDNFQNLSIQPLYPFFKKENPEMIRV